jgi:Mn-dependent DtxR family transcriptional regulator
MPTPNENKILQILKEEGGESTSRKIASKMGFDSAYLRIMLHDLGRKDIIDVFNNGKVRLANKGWILLGEKVEDHKSSGMKRYLEERAKWN